MQQIATKFIEYESIVIVTAQTQQLQSAPHNS